jgi:hypothetical protein
MVNQRQDIASEEVLVISEEIYLALHPIEQIMAQALQRTGNVKILYDDSKFKDL